MQKPLQFQRMAQVSQNKNNGANRRAFPLKQKKTASFTSMAN
jgi:hypothetical protein